VDAFFQHAMRFLIGFGPVGPFTLGIIDAILFTPLANDVLVVALSSRHRGMFWVYGVAAALGSLCGCFLLDWMARRGGQAGLKKLLKPSRLEYVRKRIEKRAGIALALACILPPPFPFTPIVAGAAAFQYPRAKEMTIIGAARAGRFLTLAALARHFGRQILEFAALPAVRWSIIALIAISIVGSALSIYRIIQRSRKHA
jgi:membrane protein DedA with SNARE-associated domain